MGPRLIALIIVLCALPSPVAAQDTVEPTDEQKTLNREAFEAMREGNVDAAIAAYERSLELGPLNVTYLNLGRAQQKAGRCIEAWAAFDEVDVAPAVPKPDRTAVLETMAKFVGELAATCAGTIHVTCDEVDAVIELDGKDRTDCPTTYRVRPGPHAVELIADTPERRDVEVPARGEVVLHFERPEPVVSAEAPTEEPTIVIEPPPQPPPADPKGAPLLLGLGVGGLATGVAVIVASAFVDGAVLRHWPAYANDHRLTAIDFVPLGGYALGFGTVVTGAILLALGVR